jgi:ATP-dependent exoDNAse (exonuclease V) beta subunit
MTMVWSDVKERLFRLERDTLVSAGAGSGKTAALVELYLRLLAGETSLPPLEPSQIIAITFTDKAAQEMRERIRAGLRQRRQGPAGERFAPLQRQLGTAPISTFHAFCARLLRENTVAAAVDPYFTVLDAFAASAELEGAMDDLLQEELRRPSEDFTLLLRHFSVSSSDSGDGLPDLLADIHRAAADDAGWFQTAIAGAARHAEEARALLARSVSVVDGLVGEVERILAEEKPLIFHGPLRPFPSLWRETTPDPEHPALLQRLAALTACIAGNWGKEKGVRGALLAALTDMRIAASQLAVTPVTLSLLALGRRFADLYHERKARRGSLDFEDLQVRTRDLLRDDATVRQRLRDSCRVVMVDEFQDTNPLQKQIVDLLCGPEQRLFVVGDPKQSIYLFRGADVSVFLRMGEEMARRGGETLYFQESFRSRSGIIGLVNSLFARLMTGGTEPFQTFFTEGDRLEAVRTESDPAPCAELLQLPGDGSGQERRRLEADAVAERILSLADGRDPVPVLRRDPATGTERSTAPRFGDMAILFRRFTHIKAFEQALRHRGIPYYVVKGKGFYQCQEIMDILSLLRCLESPWDLVALAGLLRSPLCCVSDETLFLLSRHPAGLGAWQELVPSEGEAALPLWERIDADDRERLLHLDRLLERLRPVRDRLSVTELLEEVIAGTSLVPILLLLFQGEQKVANIRKLLDLARTFDRRGEGTLRQFIVWLQKLVDREPTEAEALLAAEGENAVALMTVHQSKGLEFPVVFVPECGAPPRPVSDAVLSDPDEGIGVRLRQSVGDSLPTLAHQRLADLRRRKEEAEFKRLFYVALTRARDYLVLSGEGGKQGNSWRAWLDDWLDDGGGQHLLLRPPPEAAPPAQAAAPPVAARTEEEITQAVARVMDFRPPLPSRLVFTPTALEDYRHCPRKYYYKGVLGLDEGLFAQLLGRSGQEKPQRRPRQPAGDVAPLSPLERGNLAHLMLQRLDFGAPAAGWEESCRNTAAGYHLPVPPADMDEVCQAVATFAASPTGRELASRRLRRELPFLLRLDGAAEYHLRGAMDLVAEDDDSVTVLDYKFSGHGSEGVAGYRFQVSCYMLVLARAFPQRDIRGKLVFLREGVVEPVHVDLTLFEAELVAMMNDIRERGAETAFPPLAGCDGSRCPFRDRCGGHP